MSAVRYPRDPQEGVAPGPVRDYWDYDVDRVGPWATFAMYFGYLGPCYSQLQWDRGIVVLDKTIGLEPRPVWVADLLARNDTLQRVGTITVTANLLDADGNTLTTVRADSPVPEARPGEPVPVRLPSTVPADQVADVRYTATAGPPPANITRYLRILTEPLSHSATESPSTSRLITQRRASHRPFPWSRESGSTPTTRNRSDCMQPHS